MKGISNNPNGRPNLREASSQKLRDAIKSGTKRHKHSIYRHLVDRAYKDDTVLIAIARKILPDLKAVDISADGANPFRLIIDLSGPSQAKKAKKPKTKAKPEPVRVTGDVQLSLKDV